MSPQIIRFFKGATKTSVAALLAFSLLSETRFEREDRKYYPFDIASWNYNLLSLSKTSTEDQQKIASQRGNQNETKKVKTKEYDFIIIGNGNAGKKAIEQLLSLCPGASIAVADPLRPVENLGNSKLHYYPHPATTFHPQDRIVELPETNLRLKYRYSILLATGSRGAPPPTSLIDQLALSRVLEFRPTELSANLNRPVVPTEIVRRLALLAASQEAKVCVLGSGWEAIELAAAAAKAGKSPPVLLFGSAAPLCHILPRYLSTAVTKRLRNQGINVHERALVRYVSHHDASNPSRLEVHTAKSFDMLDTKRHLVDLLVVAPTVEGPRGTATLPTFRPNVSPILNEQSMGRTWYQSWSQMSSLPSEPSSIVCLNDDGRISVSAELSAASRVYAAGSVAKYPNSLTGHTHVAGEGGVDGALAGQMAAQHMAYEYTERSSFSSITHQSNRAPASFASRSFPIFRSDVTPCNTTKGHESALSRVGITALTVGHCDADKMSTHGFWWTNQTERRLSKSKLRQNRTKMNEMNPVYGSGIVFYLDGTGHIRGVMTWGLPITNKNGELNENLMDRLKKIITTNGRTCRELIQNEDPLLKLEHLEEESKHLANIASKPYLSHSNNSRSVNAKPLYRYTVAKQTSVTSMGFLKRKDQSVSSELLSEDIYIRHDNFHDETDDSRPSSLMYIYPMQNYWYRNNSTGSEKGGDDPYRLTQEERVDKAWESNEVRARPPKEEPLWLRRGEINREVNFSEAMRNEWLGNMKKGIFADGSAPYQHSKEPQKMQESEEDVTQEKEESITN